MKRRLWQLIPALLVMAVAWAYPAAAQIAGVYAYSVTTSCLSAASGFNGAFQPLNNPIYRSISSGGGYRTYNANGTGSVTAVGNSTDVPIPPGTTFTAQSSGAASYNLTYNFTYTVENGVISSQLVSGSYLQTYTAGSRNGQTETLDKLDTNQIISPDNTSVVGFTATTEVETATYSNGNVVPQICDRASHGFLTYNSTTGGEPTAPPASAGGGANSSPARPLIQFGPALEPQLDPQ